MATVQGPADWSLTDLGKYEGLDSFGVTGTDQSTALLQKRKKLQEVETEYVRKRREYDERMKRCAEKEAELAAKQEVIRVNVVRFERFIKDNDVKRQRALKKEKDELAAGPVSITISFPVQLNLRTFEIRLN
jgi:hypothetical protein